MRIADKMTFDQVNANVGKNRTQMSELQNQAATQKRVTKPSDDPLAAARVLANRVDLQGNKQFGKNLNYARSFLEYTDSSLGELTETLMRAKDLAISQANDASANEESRRSVASEIEQLFAQMIQIGNRKLGDRFIFGGYKTQKPPFNQKGDYNGDRGEMMIHIDKESFLAMNVPGGRVFHGLGINRDGVTEKTPKQASTIEELNYQRMSGVVIDQEHEDLKRQEAINVRGPASSGSSAEAPEVSHELRNLSDEDTPDVVNEGINLFRILRDLEISLRTNDKAGIQDSLDTIDDAISQVVLTRAQVGSRSTVLDNFMQTLEKAKVENQVNISQLEDSDIFSTISDINKTESTLQATLQTSGKLVQKSLMDFLR